MPARVFSSDPRTTCSLTSHEEMLGVRLESIEGLAQFGDEDSAWATHVS